MMNLAELVKMLRRIPADRFVKEALALALDGVEPSAELLRRCGIRAAGAVVIA